jgi:hypothetical protein
MLVGARTINLVKRISILISSEGQEYPVTQFIPRFLVRRHSSIFSSDICNVAKARGDDRKKNLRRDNAIIQAIAGNIILKSKFPER